MVDGTLLFLDSLAMKLGVQNGLQSLALTQVGAGIRKFGNYVGDRTNENNLLAALSKHV